MNNGAGFCFLKSRSKVQSWDRPKESNAPAAAYCIERDNISAVIRASDARQRLTCYRVKIGELNGRPNLGPDLRV